MKRLIGGILLAAGVLIGGASGLCTGIVALMGIVSGAEGGGLLLLALMYGGPPMLIGFGLYKWGRKLIRDAEADRLAGYD